VYSVDGWVRGALEKSTFELRDKQVVALEEGKLARVEVKSRANAYTLERDAQKAWRVVKPVALLAEQATLTSMLSGLGGERALSFPKDSPEERKRLGLEAPALDATFTPEGGGAVRLRLSKVTEGGSEKAYALREDAGGALLAEVPVSALGHLDKKAAELRDRTVLAFDKGLVHRLGFTQAGGGAEVVVEKAESPDAGGDDWKVAAPEKGPAKKWKMSSVVWTLGSLKAAAFGEKPKDWAKYGIDGRSRAATVYDARHAGHGAGAGDAAAGGAAHHRGGRARPALGSDRRHRGAGRRDERRQHRRHPVRRAPPAVALRQGKS
jgi:hypothetical protein